MSSQKDQETAVVIDRNQATAFSEMLWSNGHRNFFRTFADLYGCKATPEQLAQRRRDRRARKVARRRKGHALKAEMARYGIRKGGIRVFWGP
jgi:hypothetical protein